MKQFLIKSYPFGELAQMYYPRPWLSVSPAPLPPRDARHARHVAGNAGCRLQGEYQGAHAGTSEGHRQVPGRPVIRTLDFFISIFHWVRSAVKQGVPATSPNPSEEIFDLYGCGWEIERIEHNLRAKALKISSYARFFVFLPIG